MKTLHGMGQTYEKVPFVLQKRYILMWKSKTRVTSYEFKSSSYEFKSTSCEFKSTSYEFKSTSYEFKSTS